MTLQEIVTQTIEENDCAVDSQEILKQKVILYGAGYCGAMMAELLQGIGIEPFCFFDRNEQKQGTRIMNTLVRRPEPLENLQEYVIVVCLLTCSASYGAIRRDLAKLGYEKVYHIYDLRNNAKLFARQNLVIHPDRNLVREQIGRYEELYNALADEKSRQTLEQILRFLCLSYQEKIISQPIEEQYFAYDVYTKNPKELVVDCGAFKGEVLRIYMEKNQNQLRRYIAIEADQDYEVELRARQQQYGEEKVQLCFAALSDRRERLHLTNYAREDSVIREDGQQEVQAYPLDELLPRMLAEEAVTFLKVDVEGYEMKLLEGARGIIERDCPVIAIAAYHRESDFYEIYEKLQELYEGYHFYLRSYMNLQETILYAVPEWRLEEKR